MNKWIIFFCLFLFFGNMEAEAAKRIFKNPKVSWNDVSLSWDEVSGDVTGYRIYYSTSSGTYPYSLEAGDVLEYSLPGLSLEDGVTYYFVVRAWNSAGESENSNEVSYKAGSQFIIFTGGSQTMIVDEQ